MLINVTLLPVFPVSSTDIGFPFSYATSSNVEAIISTCDTAADGSMGDE